MDETVERAIGQKAADEYQVVVIIDGIDKKTAQKYTNALRVRGIRGAAVKGRRDESEPMIRLADKWAGAARAAFCGDLDTKKIVDQARQTGYLIEL